MGDERTPTGETESRATEPVSGAVTQSARDHRDTNYLKREVNLLKPSTPFMRDHLRVIWIGFVA